MTHGHRYIIIGRVRCIVRINIEYLHRTPVYNNNIVIYPSAGIPVHVCTAAHDCRDKRPVTSAAAAVPIK